MGAIATAFTKFDQTGKSYTDGTGGSARYARTPYLEFAGTGVSGAVSSIRVLPGPGAPTLILFDDLSPFSSFDGEFMQFTNASDVLFNLDLEGDLAPFNNDATSMIVVQTQLDTEFRFSIVDKVVPEWNDFLDQTLPSDVQRVGNPSIRWVAFPQFDQYLSPDRVYVRIKQKLNIVLNNWPDYEASISYWIRFRVDAGKVLASVSKWAYWVEGGIFSGGIADELEPKVKKGATTLKEQLNAALGAIPGSASRAYVLPGTQVTQVEEGFHHVLWGSTHGDATVIVQF